MFQHQWPFTFKVDFMERSFTLSARTNTEMDHWMRVFNLIISMNKIGVSPMAENPYNFEWRYQDAQIVNHRHTDSAVTSSPQKLIQITEHGGSQIDKSIDFGAGSLLSTNRLRASETDPVTTSSLYQA